MIDIYRINGEIDHGRFDMDEKLEVLLRLQNKGYNCEESGNIEKLSEELSQYPKLPQETGNEGLNVALMKASARCEKEGIKFCYVVLGKANRIDSMDMANIMWNLFCNGIEACKENQNECIIEVVVRDGKGETEIRFENSVRDSVSDKNSGLEGKTGKSVQCGPEMDTVYAIIDKYQGKYSCWEENNRFIQEIYLQHTQEMHA